MFYQSLLSDKEEDIENIEIGDSVVAHNMIQNKTKNHKVLHILEYFVHEVAIITLPNNNEIHTTPTHPICIMN